MIAVDKKDGKALYCLVFEQEDPVVHQHTSIFFCAQFKTKIVPADSGEACVCVSFQAEIRKIKISLMHLENVWHVVLKL